MDATQIILPAVATFALGTALLVPLRDDRRGRRATLGGANAPLRPQFGSRHVERDGQAEIDRPAPHVGEPIAEPFSEPLVEPPSVRIPDESPSSPHPTETENATVVGRETPFAWLVRVGVRVFGIGQMRPTAAEPQTSEPLETGDVDRSFASELASLLDAATDRDRAGLEPSAATMRSERAIASDEDEPNAAPADPQGDGTSLVPAGASSAGTELAASATHLVSPSTSTSFGTPDPSPTLSIVARATAPIERVVPITRLPLRPHGLAITWTRDLLVVDGGIAGPNEAGDRCATLERMLREPGRVAYVTVERAYHEEEPAGRLLALRVLVAHYAVAARAVFVDALHTGTDDERALAVEGLAAGDARDALPAAFADRVEAIAARAALEYVGFADRATFRTALSPYVDAARLDALLLLLAGIVE